MTRHLYLDIDGVINGKLDASEWGEHEQPNFLVSYPPQLIVELNDIIANTRDLRVFWLTTWEREAADFGAIVGLAGSDSWEWLPAVGSGRGLQWEKCDSIRAHIARTAPEVVIWCDDELANEPEARQWALDNHVVPIAPSNVLTREHLTQIRAALA